MSCCNKVWCERQVYIRKKWFADTYLVLHHCIANIFNQTSEFVRIFDVGEKALDLSLVFQWLEFSENVFQLPDGPFLSDSTLDLGERELTVPVLSSLILPSRRLQRRVYKVRRIGH